MNYLLNIGFTEDEINYFETTVDKEVLEKLEINDLLVLKNLTVLTDLGITNYKEVFLKYPNIFLDNSNSFSKRFNQYDQKELVEKIAKNIDIITKL